MELPEQLRYLAAHGGKAPYPLVFAEAPEAVNELVASGKVYISDYTLMIHKPARKLAQKYDLVPVGGCGSFAIYRIASRANAHK